MSDIVVVQADYLNPVHAQAVREVLDHYAQDPMGGGEALSDAVLQALPAELAKRPHAFSVLAFVDGQAAGLINCFEGFSTFAGKPLVNVHDVSVVSTFRGLGLSQKMLGKVEAIAREVVEDVIAVLPQALRELADRSFSFNALVECVEAEPQAPESPCDKRQQTEGERREEFRPGSPIGVIAPPLQRRY